MPSRYILLESPFKILVILLLFIFHPSFAYSEETYVFERMWPTLQQPWYFVWVSDVAEDSQGNVYFAVRGKIMKFTSDGRFITKWNNFAGTHAIAVDEFDNIYVTSPLEHCIRKYTSNGQPLEWQVQNNEDGQSFFPAGIDIDKVGNIYVADSDNHRIQKFGPDGKPLLKWGNQGSEDGQFLYPFGVAIDPSGNVYITDRGNHRVQKFSSEGEFLEKWGDLGTGDGEFCCPNGIDIDSEGNIYVTEGFYGETYCDCGGYFARIQKFSPDGQFVRKWGSFTGAGGEAEMYDPFGIMVSKSGVVFVADNLGWRVSLFTKDGEPLGVWNTSFRYEGEPFVPTEVAIAPDGNLVVVDSGSSRILKFSPEGQFIGVLHNFDGNPGSLAVDKDGNIFTSINTELWKLGPDGTPLTYWGGSESEYGALTGAIAVDPNRNVYVVGPNNQIQKFRPVENGSGGYTYVLETKWGTEGSGPGQFNGNIYSIDTDADGNIYAVDCGNARIQKFSSDGTFLSEIVVGSPESTVLMGLAIDNGGNIFVSDWADQIYKYSPDGQRITTFGRGGVEPGQFQYPSHLAVGPDGLLYVIDMGGNRLEVFKKVQISNNNKAIIVSGGGNFEGNNLWNATQMCANFAYRTLTYQGFTKETIHYLTSDTDLDLDNNGAPDDVDGDATNANLQQAITQWAADAESLVVYLVDHGGDGTFRMSGSEVLPASDLDSWLDQLQATLPGKITVVYDACESGSFISQLTPPEGKQRVVVGSTSPGESAYFVTQGSISFSSFFWTHIFNGLDVKQAFTLARDSISDAIAFQHPLLDDNGNGVGNEAGDGAIAQNTYIGNGTVIYGDIPVIGNVSPDKTINDTNSTSLFAENITDDDEIARVWAVIRPPNYAQGSTYNPVYELPSLDLMPTTEGKWEGTWDNFNIPGTYHIAIYARDRIGNTSIPVMTTVSVNNPLARKAVIVAASWQADRMWPAVQKNVLMAYNVLKFQGYTEGDIYVMCDQDIPGAVVDGYATAANLNDVLTNWAADGAQDLVLYMIANGNQKALRINQTESVSSETLDALLDNLQNTIPGVVTVIYDACRSGSFSPDLAPPPEKKRIVITSTTDNSPAYFALNGDISFSMFFWQQIINGANVRDAFLHGKWAIEFATQYAPGGQIVAQMDDNGNGIANEKSDKLLAFDTRIGTGIMLAGDAPLIGSISSETILNGESSAVIRAENVTTTGEFEKVWAVITPPNYVRNPETSLTDLPVVELLPVGDNRFEGTYDGFTSLGIYEISVFAIDKNGNLSSPETTRFTQSAIGPDSYEEDDDLDQAKIIVINDASPQNHNFDVSGDEDWIKFYGISGEHYTIEAGNPAANCDAVIEVHNAKNRPPLAQRDDLGPGESEMLDWTCPSEGMYHVMVRNNNPAIFGENTGYELKVYRPIMFSGLITGMITRAFTDQIIPEAIIKTDSGASAISKPNGIYVMAPSPGTFTVTAEASGFKTGIENNMTINDGEIKTKHFQLLSQVKGDANNSGDVDLADVVSALQIISGKPLSSINGEADVDEDDKIGLEEVVYILQEVSGLR